MQFVLIILFSFTLLLAEGTYEKLIVSANSNLHTTEENLLTLKVYFLENAYSRQLQEKHDLILSIEKLGDYSMVVIKPIKTSSLKKELLILLHPLFNDLYFISEENVLKETEVTLTSDVERKQTVSIVQVEKKSTKSWFEAIGLQWIALLLLAVLGLILSLFNRRKLSKIGKIQKDLQSDQKNIENEMNKLGAIDV